MNIAHSLTPEQAGLLDRLLTDLVSVYDELRRSLLEHREAISQADTTRIAACVRAEQAVAVRLSELESRRQTLIRMTTRGVRGSNPVTLSMLAERAPDAMRVKLQTAAKNVRALMEDVRQRQEVVRFASLSLMAHMQGMMRQVAQSLSPAGTYARPTAVVTPSAAGLVDLTS